MEYYTISKFSKLIGKCCILPGLVIADFIVHS